MINSPQQWRGRKERYALVGSKCDCGYLSLPARRVCPECGDGGVKINPLITDLGIRLVAEVVGGNGNGNGHH